VAPSSKGYDPLYHLEYRDVSKASKADPFRQGGMVHIGQTNNSLFPVTTVLEYMMVRGFQGG